MRTTPKRITFPVVIAAFLVAGNLQAQQLERTLLSAAGLEFAQGTVSLEWSIGEGIVGDLSAGDYRLTQGFHQGGEMTSQVLVRREWSHAVSIFPNPAGRDLYLQKDGAGEFYLTIFDALGQPVHSTTWIGNSKVLDIQNWKAGIYLILMIDEHGAAAGFKWLKQ
ncbi:MAG: T9SS type A sorting domain-containing protein [Lewinellaceae bacterium]|nr:T9SS type A sorting domain-containing protein [Lewinellaceae bacterium]